jgi:hypothetical protein
MIIEIERADLSTVPLKDVSAASLAGNVPSGVLPIHAPGDWSLYVVPSAAVQATITKAAGAAGVRHVCTSLAATFMVQGTAQATLLGLYLRDGTTGAGTQLWGHGILLPAINTVWTLSLSGLNIVGSPATAMTFEFSTAGVAASNQIVAMTGHSLL